MKLQLICPGLKRILAVIYVKTPQKSCVEWVFKVLSVRNAFPVLVLRIWLSNVVFPAPRKPVNNVTGIALSFSVFIANFNNSERLIGRVKMFYRIL